jgi:apolipoprotein N-acyltransferase
LLAGLVTAVTTWLQFKSPAPPPAEATAKALLLQENLSVGAGVQQESREALLASFATLSQHPGFPPQSGLTEAPSLIVWPESPASFYDSDPAYREFMEQLARRYATPILADDLGLGPRNSVGGYSLYNSATLFTEDGSYGGRYDKIHLVPFGEYVPYKPLFFFAGSLLNDLPFIPGTKRILFDDRGRKYGVFICYESIFGDEIRQFAKQGAQVLVNLSDDGWYGDSSAPWEHLDMARMRAIENHRWLLRSTNNGVTASIDPFGRVVDQMPRHVRGSLLARFDFISDVTFYTRHGDWIAWICTLLTAALIGFSLLRSRGRAAAQ